MPAEACLVFQLREEALLLQQFLYDAVAKAEPCTGLRLPSQSGKQLVISAASKDCTKLACPVSTLKYYTCTVSNLNQHIHLLQREVSGSYGCSSTHIEIEYFA